MTHRLANNNDFEAVYELYMDESANPYLSYDPMSTEEFEPRFASILETETLYVVEDDNGKIIASYRIIPKTDRQKHTVYLGGFVVAPHNQGKGVGSKVMSVIKEHCANDGKAGREALRL